MLGRVGSACVKVLRMNGLPVAEESHDDAEALLVLDGRLELDVDGDRVPVGAGELYLVPAGTRHAVRPGSHGTLLIVERA
ncbi:cupin domain-containing protein [Streptomyces sp. NPDC048483]|uniref:cupin domain-containing protein n=1 Tax=Streptomyces sp. NPDC048483 TaxID=3154927 RepID=UPI00343D4196